MSPVHAGVADEVRDADEESYIAKYASSPRSSKNTDLHEPVHSRVADEVRDADEVVVREHQLLQVQHHEHLPGAQVYTSVYEY